MQIVGGELYCEIFPFFSFFIFSFIIIIFDFSIMFYFILLF